jgi:prolyl oligopeptidase
MTREWIAGSRAKYAARLRAANPENHVLLRVDPEAGHGIGSTRTQANELNADMIAFINWRLGRAGFAATD